MGMTTATPDIAPPEYFQRVAENSHRRWLQLESDPELAGPWHQLFSQVQSPRHVASELLQNADDAGAKFASARIEGDIFVFEHDGADFDEPTFSSLCRFGYSNKRTLHTIGFRGIGFKSTFSLGSPVGVNTPSLSFCFERTRFTLPVWVPKAPSTTLTRITVGISSPARKQELEKNLAEWKRSGASLLFFRNINTLEVDGERVVRRVHAPGPVEGSEWIDLGGSKTQRVLLIKSDEAEFPEEAVNEIKQERHTSEDFTIPPCRVEIVLGLSGEQRLYVVLPTGVRPALPFSCNAPFIQDPARYGIKDTATSATNRWLLARIGRLAAESMEAWLTNSDLDISESVAAYDLLPSLPRESNDLAAGCAKLVDAQFRELLDDKCILVTTANTLSDRDNCIAPPPQLYDVWTPPQIAQLLGRPDDDVLAPQVTGSARQRLNARGWLSLTDAAQVLSQLADGDPPSRPSDSAKLLKLWAWAQEQYSWDYGGARRRRLKIVPVASSDVLHSSDDAVRLSSSSDALSDGDSAFLSELVSGVDRKWLDHLSKARPKSGSKSASQEIEAALQMLNDIGLAFPTPGDKVVSQAGRRLRGLEEVMIADAVRLAHIAAKLGASVDNDFPFITRGCSVAPVSNGLVQDVSARVEILVPQKWAEDHLLHDSYVSDFTSCTRQEWFDWATSGKSRLRSIAAIRQQQQIRYSRDDVATFVSERGSRVIYGYPYVSGRFTITDYDFDPMLLAHWEGLAKNDKDMWVKVVLLLAEDVQTDWDACSKASIRQKARVEERQVTCDPIPAGWLMRLRRLKCLPDTYNVARHPAELLMRTPDTEPLLGVEPFVSADLDRPHAQKLLSLLGVRNTPTDFQNLIGRVRDLATVATVPVSEVARWLGALDRLVARSDAARVDAIREVFSDEPLVLTKDEQWAHLSEVFRSGDEDAIPGLPILHPAIAELPLWSTLGIADEPDDDLIVEWLGELETGQRLEGGDRSRVRAFLSRSPLRIWHETGHWLAIDGTWTKGEEFRFHLSRRADERINALFPKLKALVADLTMIPRDVQHPAQVLTTELNAVIEYRLSDQSKPNPAYGEGRPWLLALGQTLMRVVLKDADQQVRVRESAQLMSRTVFHHQNNLRVIPYVEGAPAGETVAVRALWTGVSLLVTDRSPARYTEPLIDELSRVFSNPRVADAIRVCIDRSSEYVEEYISENFELAQMGDEPSDAAQAHTVGNSPAPSDNAEGNAPDLTAESEEEDVDVEVTAPIVNQFVEQDGSSGGEEVEDEKVSSRRSGDSADTTSNGNGELEHHHSYANSRSDGSAPRIISDTRQVRSSPAPREPGGPTFVTEFAKTKQFVWNRAGTAYIRADGHAISPTTGPFQWEWRDNRQNLVRRLWFAEQRLDKGVEIDTLVWEAIKSNPRNTSIVVIGDDGTPRSISGEMLIRMVDEKLVVVYPSTYRLKKAEP